MKFFTDEIASSVGGWDVKPEAISALRAADERYNARLEQIRESLLPDLALVASAWALDDALISELRQTDDPDEIRLVLRCGDSIDGYFDLEFVYASPTISDYDLITLLYVASKLRGDFLAPDFDVWAHEVDTLPDGRMEHRVHFSYHGWIAIQSQTVAVTRTDRPDRELAPDTERYQVARFNARSPANEPILPLGDEVGGR